MKRIVKELELLLVQESRGVIINHGEGDNNGYGMEIRKNSIDINYYLSKGVDEKYSIKMRVFKKNETKI